jgi:hypothetical protein
MLGMSFVALLAGTAALAGSGCGGSSKTSPASNSATPKATQAAAPTAPQVPTSTLPLASGKPLSKAEWIKMGEAICTRSNTKAATVTVTQPSEYATALPQIALYARLEARELSKLVPPTPKARDWARYVNGLWLDSQYVTEAANMFKAKAAFQTVRPAIIRANSLHEEIDKIAKRDGFTECAVSRVRRSSPTGR